jgi:6-hydroxycyclohex-1-ene-1-carbonyl-CoA dehydrogenase
MSEEIHARRWVMTAVGAPLKNEPFAARAGAGEVVIAVAGCGVCHTDLGYLFDGVRTNHALPLTLGHEISGRVAAAGQGAEGWLGKAVIVPAVMPCGDCDVCERGLPNICRRQKMPGNDIHGGFASHIVVPARGLCVVNEGRLEKAGLSLADVSVVADAVTTPYQAVIRAGVRPGVLAIVVGVGGVGGFAAQIAKAAGATVAAIDVDAKKLEIMGRGPAALTLNAREHDQKALKALINEFCKAQGLPLTEWFIFECSGTAAGQLTAFGLLTFGATLSVVGFTMDRIEIRLSNLMAYDARAIGNWGCPPEVYPAALGLALDGRVELAPYVEHHPLDEIERVIADARAHRLSRRAILVP